MNTSRRTVMLHAIVWVLSAAFAVTVVACSWVLGLKDGQLPVIDAGDAGDAAMLPGDERPVLLPDASTAMCDGGTGVRNLVDDADAVFVQLGGSTIVTSCGTKADPCGTIAVGIAVANANRAKAIYIAPGTYAEPVDLPSGVAMEGGFVVTGATWTAVCENITTTIAADAGVAVSAQGVLNAAIRFLTIETKSHGDVGESLFAVMATDSALTIENVNVYSELAGPGVNGGSGNGLNTSDTTCTELGTPGTTGTAATPGAFTTTGYQVGGTGGVGMPGANGVGGTYTAPSCSEMCVSMCSEYVFPVDDSGVPTDDAGNEITDGATGECFVNTGEVCGTDVSMTSCGGQGGVGGLGGGSGAASVAVLAVGQATSLTITGGALVSAGGGLGGVGGAGASGDTGEPVNTGASAMCSTMCDPTCSTPSDPVTLNGGSTTAGGTGGTGGQGGGGGGGPTFLVVTVGGANVTTASTSQWQIPTVGALGGQPNGPAGPFGEQSP
jgi:hypothetical protein